MGVTGIGGLFRAQDPMGLAAGPTVFSPFDADTDCFPAGKL